MKEKFQEEEEKMIRRQEVLMALICMLLSFIDDIHLTTDWLPPRAGGCFSQGHWPSEEVQLQQGLCLSAQQDRVVQHPTTHLHSGTLSKKCEAIEESQSTRRGEFSAILFYL